MQKNIVKKTMIWHSQQNLGIALNEVKNMMLWSLAAGGAILWGTCLVVFCQEKIQEKTLAIMMALAAGVMMAAGVFDLLPSAAKIAGWEKTVLGFVLGLGVMAALKEILRAAGNQQNNYQQVGVLVFAGIAFHDVLEGAAIEIGRASCRERV